MRVLKPVFLSSFGRSGSTFLMHVLASSPKMIFSRAYPYECRDLSFLFHTARFALHGRNVSPDWSSEKVNSGALDSIGPYPHRKTPDSYFADPDAAFLLFRGMWIEYSRKVLENYPDSREQQYYYAEKTPAYVRNAICSKIPSKTIFLFRDPRDEFVSIREFNHKRGWRGFGWGDDESESEFAKKLSSQRRERMRELISFQETDTQMYIRYEDVMRNLECELKRLEQFLGLEFDRNAIGASTPELENHKTASSAATSIERWKRELEPGVQNVFLQEIGEELRILGYDT